MASANDDERQEILLLPFFGQGHLFPFTELCRHLSKRNYKITLAISSFLSSSIPSSLTRDLPNLQIAHLPATSMDKDKDEGMGGDPLRRQQDDMNQAIESFLSGSGSGSARLACAVIDVMMSWSKDVFARFGVPTVAFFTSGACSAAMEYATWKAHADDLKPGEIRYLQGLPDEMAVSYAETKRDHGPPPHGGGAAGGPPGAPPHGGGPGFHPPPPPPGAAGGPPGAPPHGGGPGFHPPPPPMRPGGPPMWLQETQGCAALLMNTCHELEGLFLDYVAAQVGKPVWGVGPLLPEEYWRSAGSILHDREVRPKKDSSHSEEQVINWLDSKPTASVLYVSFGTEVGPSVEEYTQLATALEESNTPFIWVIRPGAGGHGPPPGFAVTNSKSEGGAGAGGYYPHGLDAKVGNRGLIIRGWAPQLLILTHPSTGGFLSHCGWNSTVEAIARGVPILAWPIRGDQFHNAKLVVSHLKVGHMVFDNDSSEMVKIDDIARGVNRLMADQQVKNRASLLRTRFQSGFPKSSDAALDAFRGFLATTGAFPTSTT